MPRPIRTQNLKLVPVRTSDVAAIVALLSQPDVRRYLCDDALLRLDYVNTWVAESLEAASVTTLWRVEAATDELIGIVGLKPPVTAAARLRAIGWRSLQLFIALEPRYWRRGLASEAVEAMAAVAGKDGVTFALLATVGYQNLRLNALMRRCGFVELGRLPAPANPMVVYERTL